MASSIGTPGSSIRFADINGDGRAEYLSVAEDGAVTAFLNGGYKFLKDGQGEIAWISQGISTSGVGGVRNQTVFADINGDGRADYLKIEQSGSGSINLWRNTGGPNDERLLTQILCPNSAKVGWWDLGQVVGGDGSSRSNVWLADFISPEMDGQII
ncbi:hypothetical protein V498_05769 [Pseudogymnoascus sp. VKM F-4517 (FW-2822)]|nr:hypothetical protein V498_05769 [Pseudogymnoascus sp. VKM F-4517 (FW-2822)]